MKITFLASIGEEIEQNLILQLFLAQKNIPKRL